MLTYVIGLIVLASVYTLFMACWLDGHSDPPLPRRTISGQEKQHHAGSKQAIEGVRNSPAQQNPAVISQIHPDMDRGDQAEDHPYAASSGGRPNIAEWIMAGSALAALLIYMAQASFMWAANTHAQTEQRAWIRITEPQIDASSLKPGYALKTAFKIKNLGLTPARIKTYFVRATPAMRWHGFSRNVDLPSPLTPNPTVVPPGTERELIAYDMRIELTEDEAADPKFLMVQFVVTYLDAFDNFRVTVACFTYLPEKDIWTEFGLDDAQRME